MSLLTRITPEELLVLPDGKDFELVDGELVEKHVSFLTSFMAGELFGRLRSFATETRVGWVLPPDCGFRCFPFDPGRVRKPDVAFVTRRRIDPSDIGDGWCPVVPDLVVEVVSPNDIASELKRKLDDYAEAGVPVVWVVYPESRSVVLHRPDGTSESLPQPVVLKGEGPLDGFRCELDDLFPSDVDSDSVAPSGNGSE